jgi:peptidoglycan/LPS O-acetylase OafA/YrhL
MPNAVHANEDRARPETSRAAAAEVTLDPQSAGKSPKAQRIPALDFTKGALVLIMVVYHWANYFTALQWSFYRYLHFLTPSFIFITGFMISTVYLRKYDAADPRLSKRLFVRGLKLLAVFIVLNAARSFLFSLLSAGNVVADQLTLKSLVAVYVTGNTMRATGKVVAFSILVPISYVLMLSAVLVRLYSSYRRIFHLVAAVFLLSTLSLELFGFQSGNLEAVTIGLLGIVAGSIPIAKINSFVRHPYFLGLAYLLYLAAITVWYVPYPLLIVGVFLSLAAIYLVGDSGGKPGRIRSEFILLGKYSLFGYISQIAILQVLAVGFRRLDLGLSGLAISFVAAFALTIMSVEVVDRVRAKSAGMDRLYKAVFA